MGRLRILCFFAAFLLYVGVAAAADDAAEFVTAIGTVDKIEKAGLTIRPRGSDGKFAKSITMKLTGTTKVSSVYSQVRSGKTVIVQREVEAKDLKKGQVVAVIYTTSGASPVLLSAVVHAGEDK